MIKFFCLIQLLIQMAPNDGETPSCFNVAWGRWFSMPGIVSYPKSWPPAISPPLKATKDDFDSGRVTMEGWCVTCPTKIWMCIKLYRLIWMYLKIIGDYTPKKSKNKYKNLTYWDSGYGLVNFGFTHCGCSVFVFFLWWIMLLVTNDLRIWMKRKLMFAAGFQQRKNWRTWESWY